MALRDLLAPTISPDQAEHLRTQVIPSSEFGRGVTAHEIESEAGDLYSQSLDAELNHDLGAASALRAKAARTLGTAPRLASRQEDFGSYAAGVLGQLAPELPKFAAAGLAGRGIGSLAGASRVGELAGAAIPGYGLSRRAAITAQEQDPEVMATSPEARAAAATREGLVGGVAGAVPISHALQSATRPGLRGLFSGAATTAAEQAGVNTGLAAYGQHELGQLNPDRDISMDTEALKEAAIAGAIGGTGMHAAFAVPGLPFRAASNLAESARQLPDLARHTVETAAPVVEQGADTLSGTAEALKNRFGPAAEALAAKGKNFAARGVAAASDAAERLPEAVRSAKDTGDFLSQVFPKIKKPAETAGDFFPETPEDKAGAAPAAPEDLVGRPAAEIFTKLKEQAKQSPEKAREYYQRAADALGGEHNPTTPEGQRKIVDALKVRANDFGGKLDDFVNSFKKKGEKSSYLDSKARPALENTVFEHLTDEARKDPAVVDKLPELTDAVSQFMARSGSLDAKDAAAITGYKRIESMFKDPDAFEKDLGQTLQLDAKELTKIRSISSAAKDAAQPNSFLYSALVDQAKDSMKSGQLRQVGDLVDRLTTADDKTFAAGLKKLAPVFGGEEKARRVLDFYSNDFKNKIGVDVPDRVLGLGTAKPRETHVPENFDQGQREFIYKDHNASRPFFAGEDTSKAAESARAEGHKVSAVNHLDFALEHGIDPEAEAGRLIQDAQGRLDAIKTKGESATGAARQELVDRYKRLKPQLDLMQKVQSATKPVRVEGHGIVQPGHEGVLQLHTMLATEPKGAESQAHATRTELGKYTEVKGAAASIKSTLINARLRDPVSGTVKPRSFSLEAMARHELQANPSEYGNFSTHPEKLRAAATRGLAKIAARPDFEGFEKSARGNELHDLVVHRESDTKLDLTNKAIKEGTQWSPEQVEALTKGKETLRTTLEKYKAADKTSRRELQVKAEQRAASLREEGKGVGPAAAYAKRRADLLDAALEKMSNVRFNEMKAEAVSKLDAELKLTNRKDVDTLEKETTELRAAESKSLDKMAKLSGTQDRTTPPKTMREKVPANQRDEFDFHRSRYFAARDMLKEKLAAYETAKRETEGRETVEARVDQAARDEDQAVRKFSNDFEVYGRERSENPFSAKDGATGEKESNYVNQGAGPPPVVDPATKQRIRDDFVKTVGPHVELRFEQTLGGKAGTYTPSTDKTKAIVRAVIASANETQGTVWHESMHHLFKTMGENSASDVSRAAYRDLKQIAQSSPVQRQLRELLKAYPKALAQLSGPDRVEESLAYLYQFWRAGDRDGQKYIDLNPVVIKWFEKIRDFFYNALGVVNKTMKVEQIMSAFAEGKFSDENLIDAALRDIRSKTLRDRMDHLAPGIGKAFDALIYGATDRLRSYGYNSLDKVADLFHKEPDREHGALGFLQRRQQAQGIEMNRFQDAVGQPTHVELTQALQNLQSMKTASSPLEKTIRQTLDRLFQYMDRSGVEMKNEKGDWVPISQRYTKDYFPRVWDKRAVEANRKELADLFVTEGKMKRSDAEDVITSMLGGDGLIDLAENEHHLGYTPANQALTARALDFITSKNAALFTKFQSKDLNEIMSKYIYQATHRAEYAKVFGNDGEVIREAIQQAQKEGMSATDAAKAQKAIMAMEGTLGHDFNPTLRKLFTGLTAYQNVVLLPFALLSSLSDAAGVSLRSNEFKDQFRAMQLGIKGIVGQLARRDESGDKLLQRAKEFGIVDSLNMLENYGNIYNSSFMSPTLRKINDKFFRWNGMEMWNKQMRLAGFEAGQRFVLRNLGDSRYMHELGFKDADLAHIKPDADGGIDFDNLPSPVKARMQAAMFRFVDGAVLRPNAAQRPVWASDPAWMLVAHLKQFAFSFQNTFIKRYGNELGHGNSKAAGLFLSFLPFGIFSGAVRRSLAGQGAFTGMSLASVLNDGSMRSGMYGTGMFLEDAIGDVHRGKLPGTSFLGPTAEHAQKALEYATGGPESGHSLLLRSTPLSPLVKDFSPAPD
jgi:ribosomal protein S15P/S13E